MKRYTHILITAVVLAILYYLNLNYKWLILDNKTLVELAIVGLIYSNAPDVDQQTSIINKWFTIALIGVILYSFYNPLYKSYGIIAAIIIGLFEFITHRKIIHSLLGGLILSAPLLYFGFIYFTVGMIGFLSHIIADGEFSLGWEKDWW